MMLSGYIPGAEAVVAVGNIAKELKEKTKDSPGRFFWVLDPVMGDNGRIYVAEEVVPAYKSLVPYADLILPNQFEAESVFLFTLPCLDGERGKATRIRPALTTIADYSLESK